MKFITVLLAVVASVLASPTHHVVDVERPLAPFDWSNMEPINMYVEPIAPAPYIAPGTRIIGGAPVPRNSVPYQCFIAINGNTWCGCSIIGRSVMMSAAHCTVNARTIQVVLGAHIRTQTEATQVIWPAAGVINHPRYNQDGHLSHDISLLRLNGQIILNNVVQIIGLPSGSDTFAGRTGFISGWGINNSGSLPAELHGVSVVIISNEECRRYFGNIIIDGSICSGPSFNNILVGSCNGDSGGPLVVGNTQVGIVSFGIQGCAGGYPSGLARVSAYRTWISQNGGV